MLVEQKLFRLDLFYRLHVVPISLPALRVRGGDVSILAEHFLARLNARYQRQIQWTSPALRQLTAFTWPGNIRQLHNVVERLALLATKPLLTAEMVDDVLRQEEAARRPAATVAESLARAVGNTGQVPAVTSLVAEFATRAGGPY